MSVGSNRIVFNDYTDYTRRQHPQGGDIFLYANDPTWILTLDTTTLNEPFEHLRLDAQALTNLLGNDRPIAKKPIFSPLLDWAWRRYRVERRAPSNREPRDVPSQPVYAEERFAPLSSQKSNEYQRLYLFNVLVALEWEPSDKELQQLEWAFRRASDYLYDVTDGGMAFGQVVFAGPSWLPYADIQIMASNRLHPRSWVDGLDKSEKRMPIRLGRGLWQPRGRFSIPWDEPEGYRTIIHEWGHYALGLHDEYLKERHVVPAAKAGGAHLAQVPATVLVRTEQSAADNAHEVVVPVFNVLKESIMATQVGVSELSARTPDQRVNEMNESIEWEELSKKFVNLKKPKPGQPDEGPGRLPLPLPLFVDLTSEAPPQVVIPPKDSALCQHLLDSSLDQLDDRELCQQLHELPLDQCWLYVVRGLTSTASSSTAPSERALIAQGTLDDRWCYRPFPLLGARPGDMVVLIAELRGAKPRLLSSMVLEGGGLAPWRRRGLPDPLPMINVRPGSVEDADRRLVEAHVVIDHDDGPPRKQVWICPLDQAPTVIQSETSELSGVKTLDGHVLVEWQDDSFLIASFSQGGGPTSSHPHSPPAPSPAPPITAGSSDGQVMLFFKRNLSDQTLAEAQERAASDQPYEKIRVTTTRLHGPETLGALPQGAQVRSNAYCITSNAALPPELAPTLVLTCDQIEERDLLSGYLQLCRLDEDGNWTPLPTYAPLDSEYAATPLSLGEAAGSLGNDSATAEAYSECYVVCWVPREAEESKMA